jgi:sugar lactone lactonase YvrE
MSTVTQLSAELALQVRNNTGESPVWHAGEQALYWVDIPEKRLYRYQLQTATQHSWSAPQMLGCISLTNQPGLLLAGAESGFFKLDISREDVLGFELIAEADHALAGMRFNDGRCDRAGRFMSGSMLIDMLAGRDVGHIYQLQHDGVLRKILGGFVTPNGMAFSPDGRRMYLTDSHKTVRKSWVYDYDTESGLPSNPRPFIDMAGFSGRPDGAAMDTDGCYWICGIDAGLVHRYTPQGVLDMTISVPVMKPSMCAFGGADLHTLYMTSISPTVVQDQRPMDGGLFAIHLPDVQGFPEPVCTTF